MRRRSLLGNNSSSHGDGSLNGYEYVDLGLPSGILWATWNAGATKEEDCGKYYQYAKGLETYQETSGSSSYRGCGSYNNEGMWYGDMTENVATAVYGAGWILPHDNEENSYFQELIDNTNAIVINNLNGSSIKGIKFVSKTDENKYVFFPLGGYYSSGVLYSLGTEGYYMGKETTGTDSNCFNYAQHFILRIASPLNRGITYVGNSVGESVRAITMPFRNRILMYNSSSDGFKFFTVEDLPDPNLGYVPIGIEVVPKEHNRYGDNSSGILGLANMDYGTPESGTADGYKYTFPFGGVSSAINNGMFASTTALTSSEDTIPYQRNFGTGTTTAFTINCAWPYGGTTTKPTYEPSTAYTNENGYMLDTTGLAGCDFNGIRNTAACYVSSKGTSQWTASTVSTGSSVAPAACAGRYKTKGTKSFYSVYSGLTTNDTTIGTTADTHNFYNMWYLPALGELLYLSRRSAEIEGIINILRAKYPSISTLKNLRSMYAGGKVWSSTAANTSNVWVGGNAQIVRYLASSTSCFAYAFMRYKEDD